MLIHCGDIEGREFYIEALVECPCTIVAGNNDFFSDLPREEEIEINGHRSLLPTDIIMACPWIFPGWQTKLFPATVTAPFLGPYPQAFSSGYRRSSDPESRKSFLSPSEKPQVQLRCPGCFRNRRTSCGNPLSLIQIYQNVQRFLFCWTFPFSLIYKFWFSFKSALISGTDFPSFLFCRIHSTRAALFSL